MKKSILLFFLIILNSVAVWSQIDVFDGRAVSNPQNFSEIGLKYMADAENLMLQGLYEDAIMAYDNAIAQNPNSAEALTKRAIAKYRIGREFEAKRDMQKAMDINPYAGNLHGFGGSLKRLNLLAFEPLDYIAQPAYNYVLSYYKKLWNTDQVDLSDYTVTTTNVNEIEDKVLIAQVIDWINNGKEGLAEEVLLKKSKPVAVHYDLLGIMNKMRSDRATAYSYFEKAIEDNPMNAPSYYYMSIIKTQEKDYKMAMELIDEAILLNPNMIKAHFHKAVLYKMQEKTEDALSIYKELKQDDELIEYELHVNMAITNKILGKPTEALSHINKAIKLNKPDEANPRLYTLRGNIHIIIGEYELAIQDYTTAIEINGQYAEAYFNRGMAQILAGYRADACYDLQKSTELGYIKATEKSKYFCVF